MRKFIKHIINHPMWFLLYALTVFIGMIIIITMTTVYNVKIIPFTILCLITTLGWIYDIYLWIKEAS